MIAHKRMMAMSAGRKSMHVGDFAPIICGLIGYGALARQLVAAFSNETAKGEAIKAEAIKWVVLCRQKDQIARPDIELANIKLANIEFVSHIEGLLAAKPLLVAEVASQQAVADYVPTLLRAGIHTIIASLGALADPTIAEMCQQARQQSNARLVIPSGAIGGFDYLEAISGLADATISYTSRKPVAAWRQELLERGIECPSGEIVLFEGSPEEAARLYPKNLNAAFAIALALQPTPLTVRVVADPLVSSNQHEIEVRSAAGEAYFRFNNAPSRDNPKSSMVTSLSLAASMRRLLREASDGHFHRR